MDAQLTLLRDFDTATIANAVIAAAGGFKSADADAMYTDHTVRALTHDASRDRTVVGFAFTAEVSADDPAAVSELSFDNDYYPALTEAGKERPLVAVLQDTDKRRGRGAVFGDNMATIHRKCGAVGVVCEGAVRDVAGISKVGVPVWAWGATPGHGHFALKRIGGALTAGQLAVNAGDLLACDGDGVVRVPVAKLREVVVRCHEFRAREAEAQAFWRGAAYSGGSPKGPKYDEIFEKWSRLRERVLADSGADVAAAFEKSVMQAL